MPASMLQLLAAHIAEPHLMSSRAALQLPTWSAYLPMNSSHTLDYRSQQDAQTFHRATLPARCDPAEILVCLHAGDNKHVRSVSTSDTIHHSRLPSSNANPICRIDRSSSI